MTGLEVYKIIGMYLLGVNVIGFAMMGIDKWKAKKRAWRIPETTLFIVAIIGGALGSVLGMHLFRHKTKHWYFLYGMPAILVIHIILAYFVLNGPIRVMAL